MIIIAFDELNMFVSAIAMLSHCPILLRNYFVNSLVCLSYKEEIGLFGARVLKHKILFDAFVLFLQDFISAIWFIFDVPQLIDSDKLK